MNSWRSWQFIRRPIFKILLCLILVSGFTAKSVANTVWLDDLNLSVVSQGWGDPHKNLSVDNHPLSIDGQTFKRGLGTHAVSTLYVNLKGAAESFSATVGVDGEERNSIASLKFYVIGDGKTLWSSGVMKGNDPAKSFSVDLTGITNLLLKVDTATGDISFDHADWTDAKFEMIGDTLPETQGAPWEPTIILTPPPSPKPRINGAQIFGVRPGSPFLFTIAATGDRPMTFSARGLPKGLQLDPQTGRITGSLDRMGEYNVILSAKNALGRAHRIFKIVCGNQIALTPQMGWNSWNCFAWAVSEDKVKVAADAMVRSGLINHGWTYINVDDFWQNNRAPGNDPTLRGPFRDANGIIVPNSRFPDMKGMADYIHSLGLKAGLYSSPGPWTCGSCAASWQHEAQDAQTYANWGFDYLKYDWCSYGDVANGKIPSPNDVPTWANSHGTNDQAVASYPYQVMGDLLRKQNRDILFSLCQYGMNDVWKWGGSVNGNSWRTTGDINDTWSRMSDIGFNQDKAAPCAKPGNWNDPDMLVVGKVGWGNLHPTHLTPNEQYTHISLWCLLSAPLLIGCDMTQLDAFTLNLLENDEVIAVDQDPLGKQATTVAKTDDTRIYAKPLADGSTAVGLFNLGETQNQVQVYWSDLGLKGRLHVRDLWRQKDLGKFANSFTATVPRHGVILIRVW
ncbi:MAG TPA: NPCBM/NEW2 domain-containing protein [Candidatus Sulfotelmatobacter sp.]|nr:NPCBM/NEW2 domain-containing protein [Candidatus Sulfotelmatobacter sp.]